MSFRKRTLSAGQPDIGTPRHSWLGFLRGTSSIGVLAGTTAAASAALPYANIVFDPRIPVVTGSGAPFVLGAGVAMVAASIASLWWASSRIRKPLDQLHVAVGDAVADGFHKRLDLPAEGIGPVLMSAADRLQDITVSVTDAGLEDGEQRLRMVFRGDAAAKFQGILTSLNSVHQEIVDREAEREEQQQKLMERAARAAETLENAAQMHHSEQAKLSVAFQTSRDGLRAIHSQLTRLQKVDPSSINGVIEQLDAQTQSIISVVDANRAARNEVGEVVENLSKSGDELRASFAHLKRELEDTADHTRNVTEQRERLLVEAVGNMEAKLQAIETDLGKTVHDVAHTSQRLREAGDALREDQARNQDDFANTLNAFSGKCGDMLGSVQSELEGAITATHVQLAKTARDAASSTNESLTSINRSINRRLEEIEDATSQFDRTINTAFRENQNAVEASVSWLDRSIAGIVERNQSTIENSISDLDGAIAKSLEHNRLAVKGAVNALTEEIAQDAKASRERYASSAQQFEAEMRDQLAKGQGSLAEAVFNVECLSDAINAAEARLDASAIAASNLFEQSAQETRTTLTNLTRKVADALETSVDEAREKMIVSASSVGDAAASAVREDLSAVHAAAEEHADFLRSATKTMREEADRLGEAQQASEIVRSMASMAEEQLRDVAQSVEEKSEAAMQAFERAAHDVEHRSKGIGERLDKVHRQAEKSNEVLGSSIEPLAGLLGRTRSMLEHISEIEESQLGPSLRRIQSTLRGISNHIEESGDEQLSRVTDTIRAEVRRTASGITDPFEQLLPAMEEQKARIEQMERLLRSSSDERGQVSSEIAREVREFCAEQIAAANARALSVESGIKSQLQALGSSLDEIHNTTSSQIDKAVEKISEKLEERATARQAGLESAFAMLQSSIEQRLEALSEVNRKASDSGIAVDEPSLQAAAERAAEAGVGKLANELKKRLQEISSRVAPQAAGEPDERDFAAGTVLAEDAPQIPVSNATLDQQINVIQGLVEAVEKQAIELAHLATESPELIGELPGASEALGSAENALAAWTRQLDNLSTAVAIAKDASRSQKQAA